MSLPGFTAEASLYKTNEYYNSTVHLTPPNGDVHLAQIELPKNINDFTVRCYPNFQEVCSQLCIPDFGCIPFNCQWEFLGFICN
jgi:hypothetical protein